MKKFLLLTLIFGALISTNLFAQSGDQPVKSVLEQMKEHQKAPMVAKTGLTDAQVDRIIEINYEIKVAMELIKNLNETERAPKMTALKAAKEKMYSEIPLSAEQIKTVYAYYADSRNFPPRKG